MDDIQAFLVRQEHESLQRYLLLAVMSGCRPCILVARRQMLYERILCHRRLVNNRSYDIEEDWNVPDLAESSDDELPELVD